MSQKEDLKYSKFDLSKWIEFIRIADPPKKTFVLLAIFEIILGILLNINPLMVSYAVNNFVVKQTTDGLLIYALIFGIIVLMTAVLSGLELIAGKIESDIAYNIREKGFKKLMRLDFSFYDKTPAGWIIARLIDDVTTLTEIIGWGLLDIFWCITSITMILFMMFRFSVKFGLIIMIFAPLTVLTMRFFQKRLLIIHREVRARNSEVTAAFSESIMGAGTSKTLHREEDNALEFKTKSKRLFDTSMRSQRLNALYSPVMALIGVAIAAIVLDAGAMAYTKEIITLGELYAAFMFTINLWMPIQNLADTLSDFQEAQASAERVIALLKEEVKIKDTEESIKRFKDDELPAIWGEIEFKNVSFRYNEEDDYVLKNFNLHVRPGEKIALVGETGAGKSTILNLACRFYEPSSGQILYDGYDYRNIPMKAIYKNLGYVLQHPHLFSGTVKENIRYGNTDASDEEVVEAAKTALAHKFIMKLEKGYDTPVGEGGGRLSEGEKQLISYARAILADPVIFVLDEATSSVDTESEKLLQEASANILKGRTSFVVAHRLSTIIDSDRILLLKNGRIAESGTHDELMQLHGDYFDLYTTQFTLKS